MNVRTEMPSDLAAEQMALHFAMDNYAKPILAALSEDDFSTPEHRQIFGAVRSLTDAGKDCGYTAVKMALQREDPTSNTWLDAMLAILKGQESRVEQGHTDYQSVVEHVQYITARRRVAQAGQQLVSLALDSTGVQDGATLVSTAQQAASKLLIAPGGVSQIATSEQAARAYLETMRLRQSQDATTRGIETGWAEIDFAIPGFFRNASFNLFIGRPGSGKTSLLQTLQMNTARAGIPSLFCSIEMPREQLIDRLVSASTSIQNQALARGVLTDREESMVVDALGEISALPLHWLDMGGSLTTQQLETETMKAIKDHGVRVVFVDYLGLLGDQVGGKNSTEEMRMTHISGRLRAIARNHNVIIVSAAQLSRAYASRSGEDQVPRMSDVRSSGMIEADCATMTGVHRDDLQPTVATLRILKSRWGGQGTTVQLHFSGSKTRFENPPEKGGGAMFTDDNY